MTSLEIIFICYVLSGAVLVLLIGFCINVYETWTRIIVHNESYLILVFLPIVPFVLIPGFLFKGLIFGIKKLLRRRKRCQE